MTPVLHSALPFAPPWAVPGGARLPGTRPLDPADWLLEDEAYAGQMALRDHLIATRTHEVHALLPRARPAAAELLDLALAHLSGRPGFRLGHDSALRPDGVTVPLDPETPLLTLGRLVQADLCLMQAEGAEHVLTGAILCFPSSWTLAEKLGRPLASIHAPVKSYDASVAPRVQRLFDAIRPGAPLVRTNALLYAVPDLFFPLPEARPRYESRATAQYLRSERQVLMRLPASGAVLFAIHTAVVPLDRLSEADRAALFAHRDPADTRA
jgi:hypothetical protein